MVCLGNADVRVFTAHFSLLDCGHASKREEKRNGGILPPMRRSSVIILVTILFLGVLATVVWSAVLHEDRRGLLTVSFLDIGQGDAIFIDAPSGRQVLIDGGPDASVLRELGSVMSWYDHSIDILVATHPDKDHIAGLIDVLERYKVGSLFQSSVQGSTAIWNTLEKTIAERQQKGMHVAIAKRGQIVDLGGGAFLEILSPDRAVPSIDTNVGCVVTRLVYGNTSFMLSCDAPRAVEDYLVYLAPTSFDKTQDGSLGTSDSSLKADVLKAGHHGSRTSSSPLFVGYVDPRYAVYSRGCDNSYGHPNEETIATFARFAIPTEDTCKQGTVTFVSDGKAVVLK